MNIVSFAQFKNIDIVYCMIDYTHKYSVALTTELIKNQADYTITNLYANEYDVYQTQSEDIVLKYVEQLGYKYAVIFSTGTEFINGTDFFKNVEQLIISNNFFIAGHILDRGDAYYELHHQCYVVNLQQYKALGYPVIGKQELGAAHTQYAPIRSLANWHDNYTPKTVSAGIHQQSYNHKCHGWNILTTAFDANLPILIFGEEIRNSKKHYYPENQEEFLKHVTWAYQRENYCSTDFVHTTTTDTSNTIARNVRQVFTPASGTVWVDTIHPTEPVSVVVYDYNQQALDYWRDNEPKINNVTYTFIKLDIIHQSVDLTNILDIGIRETFINLSNIFAYEGTMFFSSLEYRLTRENALLSHIKEIMPDAFVYFSIRAATGFNDSELTFVANEFRPVKLEQLTRPTWHNAEWI